MKRSIKRLIITLFLLIVFTLPVLGEMGGGGGTGGGMMGGGGTAGGIGNAGEMMNKGQTMRNQQGIMGMGFMHSGYNNYGNYVTFSVDNNTGAVMNYGISGVSIFNSINISNFNFAGSTTMGTVTQITNKDGSIIMQLNDNPAAVININSNVAAIITFSLADGVKSSKENDLIKIEAGNIIAYIASTKSAIKIAGGDIIIESSGGNTIFRAAPVNMPMNEMMNQRFTEEMMGNRVGAEISVGTSDTYSIVNYSQNMNVTIRSMESNHLTMAINSTDHSGKFIMMNLDNSSLNWNQSQKVNFYLDNTSMRQVMTADELYAANDSSFWLNTSGGNRMQAIMYIANFSEHIVDISVGESTPTAVQTSVTVISTVTSTPTTSVTITKTPVSTPKTPGFEISMVVLSAGLAYLFKTKKMI